MVPTRDPSCHDHAITQDTGTTIGSRLAEVDDATRPLVVCIHGGGCNAGYFDLPGHSFRALAQARGHPLLLVDRPGRGTSAGGAGGFTAAAHAILAHVHALLDRRADPRWHLLGHSIGAAIAIIIAGELRPPTLCGMALSGIGASPTPAALAWGKAGASDATAAGALLFGPPGSFSWRAPGALRGVSEIWDPREVAETLQDWPARFAGSARGVTVPVHLRLAEGERIWRTGAAEVAQLAAAFSHAPRIDAALLPGGGHLYELHHSGRILMENQLGFFDQVTGRLDPPSEIRGKP